MLNILVKGYENIEIERVELLPNHNKVEFAKDGRAFEYITLKDTVCGETEIHVVEVGSDDWYYIKCVEIPQKIAKKHKSKGGKHFEETDLISYLTELCYRKLAKFDKEKVEYFESFMRRWLSKNVVDFFRDTKIDKITDLETTLSAKNTDEDEGSVVVFDEPIDVWAELHSEIELENIIAGLEPEEQLIVRRLLDGYNASEIAREINTYKMRVSRQIKAIVEKAKLQKPKERVTRVNKHIESTSKKETLHSVKRVEKLLEKGRLGDKILSLTAKIWLAEGKLFKELAKLENLEGEALLKKEAQLSVRAEQIEIAKKDLEELERKLEKLNK
jgi:RNA polymerase sigma factor (sigma-70 family)